MRLWQEAMAAVPVLAGLGLASPAQAHPHVWVLMQADIVFNDNGLVEGVNVEWSFDDAYAKLALEGLDTNGDGVYSQDELAPLTKDNLDALKDYDYFTVLRFNGAKQPVAEATDYGQLWSGGKLEMHFHVPLKTPVDARRGAVELKVYDPDFFVDIEYAKEEPVSVVGPMPAGCKVRLKPVPTTAELDQTRAMLATKGREWKPENNEDFGAMFAQAVMVECPR
jgi:ABC-type uncharacterized transport system substrate-binding protein